MWRPADTQFFRPRLAVEITGGDQEAELLRSLLEHLGAVVLLHRIGTPGDFLKVISQGEGCAPYLIIFGHGDNGSLIFGEYGPGIDVSMLRDGKMPPEVVAQHANLPGCTVISTCCSGGLEPLARAFLHGGARGYIGACEDVEADAIPLFVMHFFYQLIRHKASLRQAWRLAASYDDESRLFALYDRAGRHQR